MTTPEPSSTTRRGILATSLITGAGFALGGLLRLPLFSFANPESTTGIILVALLFLVAQAGFGFAVLAKRFADRYPARRMWVSGVAAVGLGSLGPLLVFGQYYLLYLFVVGLSVGAILGLFLQRQRASRRLMVACGVGYFVALVLMLLVGSLLASLTGGGDSSVLVGLVPLVIGDLTIGATFVVGIDWVLRADPFPEDAESAEHSVVDD